MSHTPIFSAQAPQDTTRQPRPSSVPLRIFAVCLTSVVTAVQYTNYSPLIPAIRGDLHISSGQVGLFSTLLFLGLAVMYIPAGILIDRYGARPVLIGGSVLLAVGGISLPLFPNITWLLACRFIAGCGTGAVFVAGASVAAGLGKHASLGQGLYGGAVQIGSGLGLLVTPVLAAWFGWRGAFLSWGLLGLAAIGVWLLVNEGEEVPRAARSDLRAGLRSPSVWTLGLSHMGTFGLGNAMAAWLAIFLAHEYSLSLALAATLSSLALLSGMFFRPLGGIMLARRIVRPIPLLRMGTSMCCAGVGVLAIPLRFPPLTVLGMALIAIGATIPYTPVFNEAAHLRSVGKGIAQGLLSVFSTPSVLLGPPLIGFLFDRTGSFSYAFGAMLLFGAAAITASFLAGPAVKRETTHPDDV